MSYADEYPDDCERIQTIARIHKIYITIGQASAIWESYSESFCAGWLFLPDSDDAILEVIKKEVEDGRKDL